MAAPSMLADIIDTDELESGLRREGSFIGVNNFIQKCAASLGALWVGPGLSLAGYNGLAPEQSQQTLLMMRLLYVCPVVFNLLVLLIISRFPLTSEAMERVRKSIETRVGSGELSKMRLESMPHSVRGNGETLNTHGNP
jgi:GPH family glycoside/pentoside/hexuronide:cation symporter